MKSGFIPKDLSDVLAGSADFKLAMCESALQESDFNPYYIWLTIGICIEHERPFPKWVTVYLAHCAARMDSQEARESKDLGRALPWIFGFPSKPGPGNPLSPDSGGSAAEWWFFTRAPSAQNRQRYRRLVFTLKFLFRVVDGEKPAEAAREGCNEAFDEQTANKVDDKTLQRWLCKDLGLKKWRRPTTEWESIAHEYFARSVDTMLGYYEQTKSRETLG